MVWEGLRSKLAGTWVGEMIAVKRLVDSSGKQVYAVESRLPDGKLQCMTRSTRFVCNSRGFDDSEARTKALRFAITTDTLPQFREFIFSDGDGADSVGRVEGSAVGSSQDSLKRKIRSYVCMRQNRLTGLRFVVAISRLENGRLRAISFQDHSLVGAGISDEALHRAVRFLRGVAFETWRKQALSELMSMDGEAVGSRRERAIKHVNAFVEIEAGEKVDCVCGKNRSRGLMVACERCGSWEHAECQGFRSDKQIPADYICSACVRADREDVVVIRLDEQGECGNLQLEDLWTEAKIGGKEAAEVCCVCGCEDNQDFEDMIHPVNEHVCDGGLAVAHPSCTTAAQNLAHKAWNGRAVAAGMCQLCGGRLLKSEELYSNSGVSHYHKGGSISPNQSQSRNSRRQAKVDQAVRGAKRLRSALSSGVAKVEAVGKQPVRSTKDNESHIHGTQSGEKMDLTSSEANKAGTTVLGRRFNDPAVTVPIKKRRLQLIELPRSPSPPPRSPSPPPQTDILNPEKEDLDRSVLEDADTVMQGSEDAVMVEAGSMEEVAASAAGSNLGVSMEETKEGNRLAFFEERKFLHREQGASGKVAPLVSNNVAVVAKGSVCTTNAFDATLQSRFSSFENRIGVDVVDEDTTRYGGTAEETGHVQLAGRLNPGEILKLAENERIQPEKVSVSLGKEGHPEDTKAYREACSVQSRTLSHMHVAVSGQRLPLDGEFANEGAVQEIHQSSDVAGRAKSLGLNSTIDSTSLEKQKTDVKRTNEIPIRAAPQTVKSTHKNTVETEKTCRNLVELKEASLLADLENKDTGASSSASQSRSRDVRLHWDLNMDMEEWERPLEEDTGTFSGLGLESNVSQSIDVLLTVEHRGSPRVVDGFVHQVKTESKPVVEVTRGAGIEDDAALEDPECEGDCYASSTDEGNAESKHLVGTQGVHDTPKEQILKLPVDLPASQVQENLSLQGVDFVDSEVSGAHSSSKVLLISSAVSPGSPPESSLHVNKTLELNDNQKVVKADRREMGMVSEDAVVEDYVNFNIVVDSKSKDDGYRSSEVGRNGPGNCSSTASFVELGEKSVNDADFSGASEQSKGKMEAGQLNTGEDSSAEETVNKENQVISGDNCDFVEYDGSDEEDKQALAAEKDLREKSDGELQNADPGRARRLQEWNEDLVEEAEHVDYDDSDFRDGDEAGSEVEERVESELRDVNRFAPLDQAGGAIMKGSNVELNVSSLAEDDGGCSARGLIEMAATAGVGSGDANPRSFGSKSESAQEPNFVFKECGISQLLGQEEGVAADCEATDSLSSEKAEGVASLHENSALEDKEASTPGSSLCRPESQSRLKSSGWDQLPEGFDKAEDALLAAKENPGARSGRGSPWVSTNGRGASFSPRGGLLTSRFGRGGGDRLRLEDNTWTREGHQRAQRVDEAVSISPRIASPQELGRGRSHSRGGSAVRARGRMEPWMESPSGVTSTWGLNSRHLSPPGRYVDGFSPRGPTNAAAVAAAKVESSGFIVAPDGTVTKAGNSTHGGPPRPFQSDNRNGRGMVFNMGRGGPGLSVGVGMNIGGLRVTTGMGRSMGMGPGMGMNMGLSMGMGVGPGMGLGMPGRSGPGGHGLRDRFTGPYGGRTSPGRTVFDRALSRKGRSLDDYSESWPRREDRSPSPRKWSTSRRSQSPTSSRSKSWTKSPVRVKSPLKSANSSGCGGSVLGRASRKRSHSPESHKPESRGESPSLRSVPPPLKLLPKLLLPPPPARRQRSPPAGLKCISDSKKDGDQAQPRDRERERERPTITRVRSPPRRTSPHVVHGSALMDERDRQLLAGIRHVSPVSVRNRSSEVPGSSAVGSSRDSPPLGSPVGRVADGSSETRRQAGEKGVENRVYGPKWDEAGVGDLRISKETAKGDREHFSSREGGRDDERRDMSKFRYSSRDRDGRSSNNLKYNRDGDDDVAPRRRRPSP